MVLGFVAEKLLVPKDFGVYNDRVFVDFFGRMARSRCHFFVYAQMCYSRGGVRSWKTKKRNISRETTPTKRFNTSVYVLGNIYSFSALSTPYDPT